MSQTTKELPRLKDRLEAICIEMLDRGILYREALDQFEKTFISEILKRNDGNLVRTASTLGIHRNTLSKRIARYNGKKS
jgi:DNA-binding NtrC family response regulator